MDLIRIRGGHVLKGEIAVAGSKNASLPQMAACLLSDEPLELHNVPRLAPEQVRVTWAGVWEKLQCR